MKYVKLLIENVYLVDPESLKIIYSANMDEEDKNNDLADATEVRELFSPKTYSLLESRIHFLVLNNKIEEISLVEKREDAQDGSDLFSIKVKKIQHLSNLILEIKVGEIKKIRYTELINVREISRYYVNQN